MRQPRDTQMFRKLSSHAHTRRVTDHPTSLRNGVIVFEFLLVMPILFIVTLAIFEFGFLVLVQQLATTAVIEAGREGAKAFPSNLPVNTIGPSNDISDQVVNAVNQYLAVQKLEIADVLNGFPETTNSNAYLLIERGDGPGTGTFTTVSRGTLPLRGCSRTGSAPSDTEIVVTLCFPLVDVLAIDGNGHPVPDWLSVFGFSLSTFTFEMSSRATLE